MREFIIGATCAYLATVSVSHATTIDFELAPTHPSGGEFIGNPYLEDGYAVSTDYVGLFAFEDGWQSNAGSSNGTNTAMVYGELLKTNLHIERSDGGEFTIHSIDLGEFRNSNDSRFLQYAQDVTVVGIQAGGDGYATTFQLDGIADGIGGVEDYETLSFGSQWTNLLYVEFYFSRPGQIPGLNTNTVEISFDNIVVSAVPIPSAVWLFGSGLIGLIGLARRKA